MPVFVTLAQPGTGSATTALPCACGAALAIPVADAMSASMATDVDTILVLALVTASPSVESVQIPGGTGTLFEALSTTGSSVTGYVVFTEGLTISLKWLTPPPQAIGRSALTGGGILYPGFPPVEGCYDYAFTLVLGHSPGSWTVTIEEPFTLYGPDGAEGTYDPEESPRGLSETLRLLRTTVTRTIVGMDGLLAIDVDDGSRLRVPASQEFEAWQVTGPGAVGCVSFQRPEAISPSGCRGASCPDSVAALSYSPAGAVRSWRLTELH